MMGCSNPHPHSQVWSLSEIPSLLSKELSALSKYAEAPGIPSNMLQNPDNRPCLLCEYASYEATQADGERVVAINDSFVAVVPWWAVWPYEVLCRSFGTLTSFSFLIGNSATIQETHPFYLSPKCRRKRKPCSDTSRDRCPI